MGQGPGEEAVWPLPPGVNGLPVERVPEAGLLALCSPWQGPPPAVCRPLALAHAGVVEQAWRTGAVLPCGFGSVTGDGELRRWMAEHAGRGLATLAQLDGQSEFALKLWAAEAPEEKAPGAGVGPSGAGRSYLTAIARKAGRDRQLTAVARSEAQRFLALLFATGAPLSQVAEETGAGLLCRLELLAPMSAVDPVRTAFRTWQASLPPAVGGRLSGPWPPYYFAGVMMHGRTSARDDNRPAAGPKLGDAAPAARFSG